MEKEKGFTLTEVAVLLALVAVTAAFSIPMLSTSMRNWQLAADSRDIVTALTVAKLSATSQMTHYQVSFNIANKRWSLQKFNRATSTWDLQGSANTLSSGVANSGIAFKAASASAPAGFPLNSSAAITFNSRGIPIDGAGIPTTDNVVYLSDASDDYAVTVSLAGKVQLWRIRSGQWTSQ